MEKSIVLMFIKFFDECIISKRMKKIKNWLQFIMYILTVIFAGMFTNVIIGIDHKDISFSVIVCIAIMYGVSILMILYFKESIITILFPNEYLLMKFIKEYLGKVFRDFYLSDIEDEKVTKHIRTLSYYIANLYDLQRIKSKNFVIFSNKFSMLACKEFLYFTEKKLKFNDEYSCLLRLQDLHSEQIAYIIFNLLKTEYEIISNKSMETDSEIDIELNEFLNSKFGKKFIDENIIYNSSIFDDYNSDEWWLYNKRNLPVIEHDSHYRRYIKNNNKESYNKKHNKIKESKKNKEEKSYLSWIDNI